MSKIRNNPKVVILILGYRALPFIKHGYLKSIIRAAKNIKHAKVNLVYFDNYSRDGSIQLLLKKYKNIDILSATENYFYSKGVNVGLQYSYEKFKPDYFILTDADNPCEKDAYDELVDFAKNNKGVGLVQPLVKRLKDIKKIYSCGHLYVDGIFCRPLRKIPKNPEDLHDLPSCSISSTLVRTKVFEKCGILDPIFKIYYESSDLSFRAKKAGFACACDTKAVCFNEGAKVSSTDNFHEGYFRHRNNLILWKKHNRKKYEILKNTYLKRLARLNKRLRARKYVVDMIEESERRGIEDGIRITDKMRLTSIKEMDIRQFNKADAIVLQEVEKI